MWKKLIYASLAVVLSSGPAMANSTIPTDQAAPDITGVTTVFGSIAGGLAVIWAVRKVIKLMGRS